MSTTPVDDSDSLHVGKVFALLMIALAGLALVYNSVAASYEAILQLAHKIGAAAPERIAISFETSLLVIVAWDIVLTWTKMPAPLLRWGARLLTIVSVVANAAVGWPDPQAMLMYLPAPVVILTIVESVRHVLLRKHRQREPIPLARWVWHFGSSRRLHMLMVKWEVTSYREALETEQRVEYAKKRLEVVYGEYWRDKADADLVWMLDDSVSIDDAVARVEEIVADALSADDDNDTDESDDNDKSDSDDRDDNDRDDKSDGDDRDKDRDKRDGDKGDKGDDKEPEPPNDDNDKRGKGRRRKPPGSDNPDKPSGSKLLSPERQARFEEIRRIRTAAPATTPRELAEQLTVDTRTVQRDIQQAPDYGYVIPGDNGDSDNAVRKQATATTAPTATTDNPASRDNGQTPATTSPATTPKPRDNDNATTATPSRDNGQATATGLPATTPDPGDNDSATVPPPRRDNGHGPVHDVTRQLVTAGDATTN